MTWNERQVRSTNPSPPWGRKGGRRTSNSLRMQPKPAVCVLDDVATAVLGKGYLEIGADIVKLDPGEITDWAGCAEPTRTSGGVVNLLVGGELVARGAEPVPDAIPG